MKIGENLAKWSFGGKLGLEQTTLELSVSGGSRHFWSGEQIEGTLWGYTSVNNNTPTPPTPYTGGGGGVLTLCE